MSNADTDSQNPWNPSKMPGVQASPCRQLGLVAQQKWFNIWFKNLCRSVRSPHKSAQNIWGSIKTSSKGFISSIHYAHKKNDKSDTFQVVNAAQKAYWHGPKELEKDTPPLGHLVLGLMDIMGFMPLHWSSFAVSASMWGILDPRRERILVKRDIADGCHTCGSYVGLIIVKEAH